MKLKTVRDVRLNIAEKVEFAQARYQTGHVRFTGRGKR